MSLVDSKGEYFVKRSTEVLDFTVNWAADLGTDTIATSGWTVPTGITKDSSTNNATTATAWLSGGTAGTEYACVNTITTAGALIFSRTLRVKVVPPAAVSTSALITLDYFKQALGRQSSDPDTDPENDLFISLINAASAQIVGLTGRTFKINNFVDRISMQQAGPVTLREFPLVYVKSLHNCTQNAITLTNTAANAVSAQAWVTADRKLNLLVVGGTSDGLKTVDLTIAATDTLSELVSAIIALGSGWGASLATGRTGYELCEDLIASSALKIASNGTPLQMLGSVIDATYEIDFDAGLVYWQGPGWIKYRAGYTDIPADLQLITARYVMQLYGELSRDPGLESERIGDYSYTRISSSPAALQALESQLVNWKGKRL